MSKPTVVRFWFYSMNAGHPVKIKIAEGQTFSHCESIDNGEGFTHFLREWSFDGEKLTIRCAKDARDCDGRFTSYDVFECPVQDVRAGHIGPQGVEWPAWQRVCGSQRDYSAEAAGY